MQITIRSATPDDAAQIIGHINRISEEPGSNIELSPGEFPHSVEEEGKILAEFAQAENAIFLVAEVNGDIIGTLNCKGSPRAAISHVVTLGMSVAQGWRHQGIGTALLTHAIEWAKATSTIKRIELSVFTRNISAIQLYEKFGFLIEGRRRKAIHRDGEYIDNYLMALLL